MRLGFEATRPNGRTTVLMRWRRTTNGRATKRNHHVGNMAGIKCAVVSVCLGPLKNAADAANMPDAANVPDAEMIHALTAHEVPAVHPNTHSAAVVAGNAPDALMVVAESQPINRWGCRTISRRRLVAIVNQRQA